MKHRMVLKSMQSGDVVEGETYILMKEDIFHEHRECVMACWGGDKWVVEGGSDLAHDWPDVVFENPFKAQITDSMTLEEYHKWAKDNTFHPGTDITYPALGLCGEAGEFADKVKKMLRDNKGEITDKIKNEMVKELGDALFYISMAAERLGVGLNDVAKGNIQKVADRKARDVLHGNGDNR